MRRFCRRLLNCVAVLSLLLWAGTTVLWVGSYFREQILIWHVSGREFGCLSVLGTLDFTILPSDQRGLTYLSSQFFQDEDLILSMNRHMRFGFGYDPNLVGVVGNGFALDLPHWLFCLVFLALPVLRVLQWLWKPPQRLGACRACGYDMRATPDRCPECGQIPPKKEIISN